MQVAIIPGIELVLASLDRIGQDGKYMSALLVHLGAPGRKPILARQLDSHQRALAAVVTQSEILA